MLGKRLRKKPEGRRDKLEELLQKMEGALISENYEVLPELLDEFDKSLDIALKGGFIKEDVLKRYQRVLKHLEELAQKKREELVRMEKHFEKLKKYGEYG